MTSSAGILLISQIRVTRVYLPSSGIGNGAAEKSNDNSSHSPTFVLATVTSPDVGGAPGVKGTSSFIVTVVIFGDQTFIVTILSLEKTIGAGKSVYMPCHG